MHPHVILYIPGKFDDEDDDEYMETRRRKQRLQASNEAYMYDNEVNNREKALPQKMNVLLDICEEVGVIYNIFRIYIIAKTLIEYM